MSVAQLCLWQQERVRVDLSDGSDEGKKPLDTAAVNLRPLAFLEVVVFVGAVEQRKKCSDTDVLWRRC